MSYLVLARKYRPQKFEDVVQQDHVTQTLTNAISAGRVAHAILFSGPRGTGKTTIARLLAKAMNCEKGPTPSPCNACRSCREITAGSAVDVFEIDGASNNSVDQIRELRENIKYKPAYSSFKIYIIDEVHMLSVAAFNALLKTLEEPPAHVMFIFATTEPHKIPITILSRCQRHDLRRIDIQAIVDHMARLCKMEDVDISTEGLSIIAREAGGCMRDALSLLDQVMACADDSMTDDALLDLLGVIDRRIIFDLARATLEGDVPELLEILDRVYGHGHDLKKLYADLVEHFRNLLVVKLGKRVDTLVDLPVHEIEWMQRDAGTVSGAFLSQLFDLLAREEASVRLSAQTKLAVETVFLRLFQIKPALSIDELISKLDLLRQELPLSLTSSPGPSVPGDAPHGGLTTSAGSAPVLKEDPAAGQPGSVNEDRTGFGRPACHEPVRAESAPSAEPPDRRPPPAELPKHSAPFAYDPGRSLDENWQKLTASISNQHPALAASLKRTRAKSLNDHKFVLEVTGTGFSANMVRRKKNIAILTKVCHEFFNRKVEVVVETGSDPDEGKMQKSGHDQALKKEAFNHPLVKDAMDVFQGQIVDVKLISEVNK